MHKNTGVFCIGLLEWYKKGDKIGEAVITDITTKEIILRYDTLDFKIAFKNNDKINIY